MIEKEVKTKAFSKEGLNQAVKVDPREAQKAHIVIWINSSKEQLKIQVDKFEAEIEHISLKEKKQKEFRINALKKKVSQHKYYIECLENIQRHLGNDMIVIETIEDKKEDLDYYIESSMGDNFDNSYDIFEGMDLKSSEPKRHLVEDFKKKDKDFKEKVEKSTLKNKVIKQEIIISNIPKNDTSINTSPPLTASILQSEAPSFASAASLNLKAKELMSNYASSDGIFTKLKNDIKLCTFKESEFTSCLNIAAQNLSGNHDLEKIKSSAPKQPYAVPNYYPTSAPLFLENPFFYEKLDSETLFFIFYYQQSSIMQFFAAKELKKQSWRFHKKYMTWFQRLEEPKKITEDFEQGTYLYFDFESSWCQRKKSEFSFEYKFLEEELKA